MKYESKQSEESTSQKYILSKGKLVTLMRQIRKKKGMKESREKGEQKQKRKRKGSKKEVKTRQTSSN